MNYLRAASASVNQNRVEASPLLHDKQCIGQDPESASLKPGAPHFLPWFPPSPRQGRLALQMAQPSHHSGQPGLRRLVIINWNHRETNIGLIHPTIPKIILVPCPAGVDHGLGWTSMAPSERSTGQVETGAPPRILQEASSVISPGKEDGEFPHRAGREVITCSETLPTFPLTLSTLRCGIAN